MSNVTYIVSQPKLFCVSIYSKAFKLVLNRDVIVTDEKVRTSGSDYTLLLFLVIISVFHFLMLSAKHIADNILMPLNGYDRKMLSSVALAWIDYWIVISTFTAGYIFSLLSKPNKYHIATSILTAAFVVVVFFLIFGVITGTKSITLLKTCIDYYAVAPVHHLILIPTWFFLSTAFRPLGRPLGHGYLLVAFLLVSSTNFYFGTMQSLTHSLLALCAFLFIGRLKNTISKSIRSLMATVIVLIFFWPVFL